MTNKKLVTFTVKENGSEKTTRVNVNSVKKSIVFDLDFDTERDLRKACEERAIEKMYGRGKYFIEDNSGIDGRGQIWQSCPTGGSGSHTGIVNVDSDFYD
jgi:hypothetical protein